MTTDTRVKEVAPQTEFDGKVFLGGMAKGSGMIHPNMATMLGLLLLMRRLAVLVYRRLYGEPMRNLLIWLPWMEIQYQ